MGLYYFSRKRNGAVVKYLDASISVPEILGVLGRGPLALKAVALRPLLPILEGEVDMLQEIIDEAHGVHNKIAPEGNLFDVLLRDLAESELHIFSQEIVVFFLICTRYDSSWDESDQWNALVLEIIALLRSKHSEQVERCIARGIPLEPVRERIQTQSQKDVTQREMPPVEFGDQQVDLLSFNTRVECADCGKLLSSLVCTAVACSCGNALYCGAEHKRKDKARHQRWCYLTH
eukprot:GEMP01044218.1.p1 GENE.GEMP01044218.1~~GEMP01044218.1.p1  ORF type:complete len:233 (+),score=40.57 GEMP01044218.1:828-1526(+)